MGMRIHDELECWRCGSMDERLAKTIYPPGPPFIGPPHQDGGGTICHPCYCRIYGIPTGLKPDKDNDNYYEWMDEAGDERRAARDREAARRQYEP